MPSGKSFVGQKTYPSFSSRRLNRIFTDALSWFGCKASEICSPPAEKWSHSRRGLKFAELNDRTATHDPLVGAFILPNSVIERHRSVALTEPGGGYRTSSYSGCFLHFLIHCRSTGELCAVFRHGGVGTGVSPKATPDSGSDRPNPSFGAVENVAECRRSDGGRLKPAPLR